MTDEKLTSAFIGIIDGDDTINKEEISAQDNSTAEILNLYESGKYPIDTIQKFMAALDNTTLKGTAALNEAVKACSNFNTAQEAINQMISDLNASDSDTFLQDYCGIILGNSDTGAFTI